MPTALPPTRYRIIPRDPHAHLFEVACTVEQPAAEGQRFRLPVWIPGSYLVREFARQFVSVRAECNGESVRIEKVTKDSWRAAPCRGELTVIADVYAFDLSVRTAYLDGSRAYFNGTAVFLCPEGRESAPCVVDIAAPPFGDHWRVATTLPREDAPEWGYGHYRAASYDELIDHPVEISDSAHASFEAGGVVHDVTITGRHAADLERLAGDLKRVCQWQVDFFGGAPESHAPFDRYLFQVMAVGDGYGGLEHRSSSSLLCSRNALPRRGVTRITDDYRSFLGLASHEYFHAWNIKRIKPEVFTSYDLSRENYTRQLWAFEGITSYYDDLALARSGVIDATSYLELLGRTVTGVLRTPGRSTQSLAESSFDAWIKFYRPDENTPNAVVSYYAKGALVALALDLTLRLRGSSLDQLMRALWQRYGRSGEGVPEDGIKRLATDLAGDDLAGLFERYVDGAEDPPLADLLARVGVMLHLRPAEGGRDRGGSAAKDAKLSSPRTTLGIKLAAGREAKLQYVFRDGPAARAGLAAGDLIVAVDGLRASPEMLEALAERTSPGQTVSVHAFRRDELVELDVTLDAAPSDTAYLALDESATAEAIARRTSWIGPDASVVSQ